MLHMKQSAQTYLKYGVVNVDAVIIQITEHQVDSWQFHLESSTLVPLKQIAIDTPDPHVVREFDSCVFANNTETIVDKVASFHLVHYLRDTQWCLQLFKRWQIQNVVLCETWNVQCLILVGVQCHSV